MIAKLILPLVRLSGLAYSQGKLDVEKYVACEVFKEKETYDAQARISEIQSLED